MSNAVRAKGEANEHRRYPEYDHPRNKSSGEPHDLEELLAALDGACENGDGQQISLGEIMDGIGRRSFGPLLMVPALVALTPAGAIPGLPTAMAVIVLLIAGQMFFGMDHFWIPKFLEERKMGRDRLERAVLAATPVARTIDSVLRPRLMFFTREPFLHAIMFFCVVAALIVPVLELLPLAAAIPNIAILIFGLAIIAHDGLLAIAAMTVTLAGIGLIFAAL